MSVVVVVTGAGTVVCCVVVVELCVALSVPQPVADTRATAATQARISFIVGIILFGLLVYKHEITPSVGHRLWGITLRLLVAENGLGKRAGMREDSN